MSGAQSGDNAIDHHQTDVHQVVLAHSINVRFGGDQ